MDWSQLLTPLFLTQLLAAGVTLATPLALAALGEVFAERSGSLNLGLEGIMLFSGFIGFNAAYHIGNLWIGILGAVMMGSIIGLRLNAVGESPQTADTLGVNVGRIRYICVVIGGALAGMAGAFYSLVELGSYSDSMINGRGFIASALVIFGRWDPVWTFGGALLFGLIDAFQNRLQVLGSPIPSNFLQVLPYVMTILVLLIGRIRKPPAALCIPYVRK